MKDISKIQSEEELDEYGRFLEDKRREIKYKEQEDKISSLTCLKCKTKFKKKQLNPKEFLEGKGSKKKKVECDNCKLLNMIQVTVRDEGFNEVTINQTRAGFAFMNEHPKNVTDQNILDWLEDQHDKITKSKSPFKTRDEKMLLVTLYRTYKKQSEIEERLKKLEK